MKIGIIGLPQVGKKTLFQLLTSHVFQESELPLTKPVKGVAQIKDPRFDKLVGMYNPKKNVRAKIDIELLPDLDKETIMKADIFKDIADADAICHVVRAFENDSVYHVKGSVDARRDINEINSELVLSDLIFVEKRLANIEKGARKAADEALLKEKEVLLKLKGQLDQNLPLRLLQVTPDEKKSLVNYPLITQKEMIIVLNVSENDIKDTKLMEQLEKEFGNLKISVMQASIKVESEIAALESEKEKEEFLGAVGIKEPAVDALTRVLLEAINLISFFTVGPTEVHHWNVKKNSLAPEAARAIHTDLEKGFIRAEVMKYTDLIWLGSEEKVKNAGKLYVKGKDYIVEDGDIIYIRFNV